MQLAAPVLPPAMSPLLLAGLYDLLEVLAEHWIQLCPVTLGVIWI